MRRLVLTVVVTCALVAASPAAALTSRAQLWSALGGKVTCGVAIHPSNSPPMQLLCSAASIPAPKIPGIGDPGFVFLGATGRPSVARLSQDSFVGTRVVPLRTGRVWRGGGPILVTCNVGATSVRCVNHMNHGFTITRTSYRAF